MTIWEEICLCQENNFSMQKNKTKSNLKAKKNKKHIIKNSTEVDAHTEQLDVWWIEKRLLKWLSSSQSECCLGNNKLTSTQHRNHEHGRPKRLQQPKSESIESNISLSVGFIWTDFEMRSTKGHRGPKDLVQGERGTVNMLLLLRL